MEFVVFSTISEHFYYKGLKAQRGEHEEGQPVRKRQDNSEKETRVKNPLGQDESFSKMML